MYTSNRQKQSDIYTEEQVRRILVGSGTNIESEVDSDFIVYCPYHNNYRTPAGEVSKQYGTFYCFSCQTSVSLVELVMFTTKKNYFETLRFINSEEKQINIVEVLESSLINKPEYNIFNEELIEKLHTQALDNSRAIDYYISRGIKKLSLIKFKLGYSEKQDMVTVPIKNPEGNFFVGFVGRSIEGKEFKNTPGLPKSKILFNLDRVKRFDSVFLVESSFDVIRLDQCNIPAVATLGSTISSNQCDLLKRYFNSVILIADNDEAGQSMQEKLLNKLGNRATIISIPSRFKDVGDMTDEDINILAIKMKDPLLSII
jgi:DNA primase